MQLGRLSKILTKDQEHNLNKLDWFLTVADREIDKIHSFFERLELLDIKHNHLHKEYKELISFKIKQLYHLIISLEQNIYTSSFDYYQQHFGLFKNKNKFLEMKELTVSYQFESFLAQLKTIIDLFLKYIWQIKLRSKIKKMDSFESITREMEKLALRKYRTQAYKRARNKINLLKKEKILSEFFKNYDAFYNLKNYRDFIIHNGRIKQEKFISQTERYIRFDYCIPKLEIDNKEYTIRDDYIYRLDAFCRIRFLELMYLIWRTLNRLIEPNLIKKAKEEIKKIDKEKIRDVLKFLGRKLMWNDKSFMNKKDVIQYLEEKDLRFSDLIVEQKKEQRQNKGLKSVSGDDMSYILERTMYKPIGYLQFNKVKYIYDRDWKPEKQMEEIYGFVKNTFNLDDIKNPSKETKKILDLFIQLGLIIKINENEDENYLLVDEQLQHFLAMLLSLSQYKWSFIQYPQIKYFRKPTKSEKEVLKKILKDKHKEYMKKLNDDRKAQQVRYKEYKLKQKAFHKKKVPWLDMQKKWLSESKKGYLELLNKEKKKFLKIRREYAYLRRVLELINKDFFTAKVDL